MSSGEVRGRVVAVTGASGDVGRARARKFAEHGDYTALARSEVGLAATVVEVAAASASRMVPVDVFDHAEIAVTEAVAGPVARVGQGGPQIMIKSQKS